jgi:hypothetical protein
MLECKVVFYDPVMHDDDASGAVAVRVSIFFRGAAMGGPSGMANAKGALNGPFAEDLFEVAQLPRRAAQLQPIAISAYRNARRIVPAVFKAPQAFNDDGNNFLCPDIADNATHVMIVLGT